MKENGRREEDMFYFSPSEKIPEISHKRMEHPRKEVYFNHIHRHAELLLFLGGEAAYNVDGHLYTPSPYDLLLIPADTYHYLIPEGEVPYENYVLGFDPDLFPRDVIGRLFSPPYLLRIGDDGVLRDLFSRLDLYRDMTEDGDFARLSRAILEEIVIYLSHRKEKMESGSGRRDAIIEETVRYVEEHIEEPLDARRIAAHLHLSPSYVQNVFSTRMHIGIKAYIGQKKIYAAHRRMAAGLSPGEAAAAYGFSDYSVFYRLYRRTFGKSPGGRGG